MPISADSYPSRAAVNRDSSNDNLDRFMKDNVRQPTNPVTMADDEPAPEREYAGPGLDHVLASSAPRPNSSAAGEVHGAMYSPQTTLKHAAAHEPGFPQGWTGAKTPQATTE